MDAETFRLPLTWSAYWFRSYLDCQLKQRKKKFLKKTKFLSDVSMSTVESVP